MFNIAVVSSGRLERFEKLGPVPHGPIRPMDLSVFSM
jgi:hypothetical protein